MAMVEPFLSTREGGRVVNQLDPDSTIKSIHIAAGLGASSAYTWLKLPVVDGMDEVLAATALPVLLLGGEVAADQDAQFAQWSKVLGSPQVKGMVVGRTLLYPPDGNVAAAVDATVEMI
jgi:DhnA family fructose-bisphosphate aldolase class Ia